ncbi:TPA: poly-gamma-glutamate hydrolase family protein [Bacillus toyonensis]|nr:poly-gamma-glutamate hydrolase family protein [Bacillus toyonensis]
MYKKHEKMLINTGSRDKYFNFHELKQNERINIDYKTFVNKRNNNIAILAIHGGEIEPGTSELAIKLAEKGGYSSYVFEALKVSGNRDLHITSTNFDDENARNMARKSNITISIHGYRGEEEVVYIGGLDKELKMKFLIQLKKDGFSATEAPADIAGIKYKNIVNDNKKKAGVQLELTTALRKSFFENGDLSKLNRVNVTKKFDEFLNSLYMIIENNE